MAQVPNPVGRDGVAPEAAAEAPAAPDPTTDAATTDAPTTAQATSAATSDGARAAEATAAPQAQAAAADRHRWSIAVTGLALVLAGGFLVEVLLVFEIVRFAADLALDQAVVVATSAVLVAAACAALVGWVLAVVAIRRRQGRLIAWIAVLVGALGFMLAVVLGLVALGLSGG